MTKALEAFRQWDEAAEELEDARCKAQAMVDKAERVERMRLRRLLLELLPRGG